MRPVIAGGSRKDGLARPDLYQRIGTVGYGLVPEVYLTIKMVARPRPPVYRATLDRSGWTGRACHPCGTQGRSRVAVRPYTRGRSDPVRRPGAASSICAVPTTAAELLDAIYDRKPFRQALRDLGLTPDQVWGLTKTDETWSTALEAALTATRRDDLQGGIRGSQRAAGSGEGR